MSRRGTVKKVEDSGRTVWWLAAQIILITPGSALASVPETILRLFCTMFVIVFQEREGWFSSPIQFSIA